MERSQQDRRVRAVAVRRSILSYLTVRLLGKKFPGVLTGPLGLVYEKAFRRLPLPSENWMRIRPLLCGICGSDLSVVKGSSSLFLCPLISFPFVPGHEVIGIVSEAGQSATDLIGKRVVLEPALGCAVRELNDRCRSCASGSASLCERVTEGIISPGIQTGYCAATGGGWSEELIAHRCQVHPLPESVSDEEGVLVEPFSCSLHGALYLMNEWSDSRSVLIIGAGTIGLLTLIAIRSLESQSERPPMRVAVVARYKHQSEWARKLGADAVIGDSDVSDLYRALADYTGARIYKPPFGLPTVLGGFDAVIDCVGSQPSLNHSVRWARAGRPVLLLGMPAEPKVAWTAIWFKEVTVRGLYTYSQEHWNRRKVPTFTLALELITSKIANLSGLVTHIYPLSRWREALQTALQAGKAGAIKVALCPDETRL